MTVVRQLEYYQIGEEDVAWGTAATVFTGMPWDEYSVRIENEVSQQDKHTGEVDDVYVDITGQDLTGSAVSQVWPENVELLLDIAGLPRVSNDLKSFTAQFFDIAKGEYVQQTGLKCDSCEISASGSDPKLKFNFDLIGKAETVISSFAKPTLPGSPAFEFHDGIFTVRGGTEANITEFSISISNNLLPSEARDANRNRKWIDPGRRQIEVNFVVRVDTTMAAHYMQLSRDRDRDTSFVVEFTYPGTGSPIDTLTLTCGKLVIQSVERTGGVGDLQHLTVSAIARKPAATDAIVVATA